MPQNSQSIRILQVARMKKGGGVASVLMNYYRNIDRSKVQFDFLDDSNADETFEEEILRLGGKYYKAPNYKRDPLRFVLVIDKIVKKYDIVHTHELAYNILILFIARINGVSHSHSHSHSHIQDGDYFTKMKRLFVKATHPFYRLATKRFAVSENSGKFLYGKKSFEKINNAIDVKRFLFSAEKREKVRNKLDLSNDVILVGYIARFEKQKNHVFLIDVFEEIVKLRQNVRLLLVGDGSGIENIKEVVIRKKVADKVIFYGRADNVNELYSAMDIFAFPSLGEGLGIVGIEAQTAGLHVVASKNITIEMQVSDLVKWLDLSEGTEKWAKVILECAKNPKRKDMYDIITKARYNISEESKKLMELYVNEMIGTKRITNH